MTKGKPIMHLVLDRKTGDVLSKHATLKRAKIWLKAYRDAGFDAVIAYT